MTKKAINCSVCGANIIKTTITYTQEIEGKVYLIEDVPAEVCSQCGEVYLSPDTVDAIQEIASRGKTSEVIKVPVYHYHTP